MQGRVEFAELSHRMSAVGAAEVGARLVAAGPGGFRFLAFVFGKLFVGVGKGIPRSKHGIGSSGLLLLFAQSSKFVADLPDRPLNGFHFDEQVADLFQNDKGAARRGAVRLPEEQGTGCQPTRE